MVDEDWAMGRRRPQWSIMAWGADRHDTLEYTVTRILAGGSAFVSVGVTSISEPESRYFVELATQFLGDDDGPRGRVIEEYHSLSRPSRKRIVELLRRGANFLDSDGRQEDLPRIENLASSGEDSPSGMENSPWRIALFEDHELMRQMMSDFIDAQRDLTVVDGAGDGSEALNLVSRGRPDVVLMDLQMPKVSGLEATRTIRQFFPSVKILVVSMHNSQDVVLSALDAGASGFVGKDNSISHVLTSIRKVARGHLALNYDQLRNSVEHFLHVSQDRSTQAPWTAVQDQVYNYCIRERLSLEEASLRLNEVPDMVEAVLGDILQILLRSHTSQTAALGPRELDLLALLAQGQSIRDVAARWHATPDAVEVTLRAVREKLGAATTTEALSRAQDFTMLRRVV